MLLAIKSLLCLEREINKFQIVLRLQAHSDLLLMVSKVFATYKFCVTFMTTNTLGTIKIFLHTQQFL